MSREPVADQVWRMMSAVVIDKKDAWRRAAVNEPVCRSAGFASCAGSHGTR